jgi:hypothetical protein
MRGPVQSGIVRGVSTGLGRVTRGRAATRLVQGVPASALRTGFTGWVGFAFQTFAPITVTHLSRWALVSNTASHNLGLWGNLGEVLATATADCASVSQDGWVDVAISPVVLPAGLYRVASSETDGGDQWHDEATYTLAGGITLLASIYGITYPNEPASAGKAYVPVSLNYRT